MTNPGINGGIEPTAIGPSLATGDDLHYSTVSRHKIAVEPSDGLVAISTAVDADSQFSEPAAVAAAKARHDFPTYLMFAGSGEESLMLTLLLARQALIITSSAPRRRLGGAMRATLEKATDGVDATFAILRDTIRSCPAYARMADDERAKLEAEILTVYVPEDGGHG